MILTKRRNNNPKKHDFSYSKNYKRMDYPNFKSNSYGFKLKKKPLAQF